VYVRKPRGGPADLPEAYAVRLSYCCGWEGCRRRVLPPSVLFWGRRVYWAAVLLVLTALREGRVAGITADRLRARFGVTRLTLVRWRRYFRACFPQLPSWRRLVGRLWPPVRPDRLVGDVLARFVRARGDPERGLVACLVALAPGRR
jgi:hypothetical protein